MQAKIFISLLDIYVFYKQGLILGERRRQSFCVGSAFFTPWATQSLTAKLLLVLASTAFLGSKSHGTRDHILLSGGSGSPQSLPLSLRDRVAQLYPQTPGLFSAFYDSQALKRTEMILYKFLSSLKS
jgi:hypothetical protein